MVDIRHWSDCNSHDEDGNGECDCGGVGQEYLIAQSQLKSLTDKELSILRDHIRIEAEGRILKKVK